MERLQVKCRAYQYLFCHFSFPVHRWDWRIYSDVDFPILLPRLVLFDCPVFLQHRPIAATSKKLGYAMLTGMCPTAEAICFPGALFIFPCEFFPLDFCCWLSDSFVLALSVRICLRLNSLSIVYFSIRETSWVVFNIRKLGQQHGLYSHWEHSVLPVLTNFYCIFSFVNLLSFQRFSFQTANCWPK